jgi:hypothetical protein
VLSVALGELLADAFRVLLRGLLLALALPFRLLRSLRRLSR